MSNFLGGAVLGSTIDIIAQPFLKMRAAKLAKTEAEALKAAREIEAAGAKADNVINSYKLLDEVNNTLKQAQDEGIEDIEEYVLSQPFSNNVNKEDVLFLTKQLQEEKQIAVNSDGTFALKVNNWREAANVSVKDLAEQTDNNGIELMDTAVKDIWKERGWLTEDEELVTKNKSTSKVTVNTKAANRIKDRYLDKFQMNNKTDIEWVEGKINGADGTTQALEYKGKTAKNNSKNIKILINKNAENPYAVLRSELEHARDIAKGEVPDQKVKHFNRYDGINESEMSLGYVKKKADTRAVQDKYTYNTNQEVINGLETGVKQLKDKNNKVLAEIRYAPRGNDFEVRMDNYGIEKGAARKALADLMQEYPDKTFHWEAINEQSVKSFNHFKEEYPELAKRVKYSDSSSIIDETLKNLYNSEKGVIDDTGSNSSQYGRRSQKDIQRTDMQSGETAVGQDMEYDEFGIPLTNRGTAVESGSGKFPDDGKTAVNSDKSQSSEPVERGNKTTSGETFEQPISKQLNSAKTTDDVFKIIDKEAQKNTQAGGKHNWVTSAEDADKVYEYLSKLGVENLSGVKEIFAQGNIETANRIMHLAIAGTRIMKDLQQQLTTVTALFSN